MKTIRTTFLSLSLALAACGGEEVLDEVPSPDGFGSADTQAFKIVGTLGYGQTAKSRLYSTKTWHGYTVEALEGAVLDVTGTTGRGIAVYGPEDRAGTWGPVPQASRSAGTLDGFVIPEDGRYLVMIGNKLGNYSLTLTCLDNCDLDEAAGKVLVNGASKGQLDAAGLDGDDIMDYRQAYGLAGTLDELGLGDAEDTLSTALHRVFFSPKVGAAWGWSPEARARKAFLLTTPGSPAVTWVPGDVATPVVDLFRRAEHEIDLAMYGMSLSTDEGAALLAAAARGVQVKVYLDVSERDPEGNPYTETVIRALLDTDNVEVKVPKYSSKMMHEKFGLVDGVHAFDGSANVSRKARDTYTEDRFIFMNSPDVVQQFQDEWNRLWNTLSKDASTII